MSSKKEITIDYLDRKTKVLLPEKYSDFIKLCKETFYISESRSENMCLKYIDDEGDENDLEDNDYTNDKVRNCPCWKLIINDNDSEPDEVNDTKEELITIKKKILKKAKDYKSMKLKEYNEIIEKEVQKRNDAHKKNLEELNDVIKTKIKDFKKEINGMIKKGLKDISQKIMNSYNTNVELTDNEIKNNLKELIKNIGNECENEINKVNVGDIGEQIDVMKQGVDNCMYEFNEVYKKSKSLNAICEIDPKIERTCQISKKGVNFELNVKNNTKQKLKGNYILDIRGSDDINENYQVNLDLSDINPNEVKSKEILFHLFNEKEGSYNFTLYIKDNNNIISNESKLILVLNELGSMNEMFGC